MQVPNIASLAQLLGLMTHHGATRVYAKKLSPNDNSKNQIYLGGDFSALNIIPHQEVVTDDNEIAGSKRDRAKAGVKLFWIDSEGKYPAPDARLILYPKYPEVRMSGFLKGCSRAPSHIMASRDGGRTLFLGVTAGGEVIAYAIEAGHPIAAELAAQTLATLGVFLEVSNNSEHKISSKAVLLEELRRIYELQWIASQKLTKDGIAAPYAAQNGGGYTLESALGISANSKPEPDFMGWEVKQYGVNDFDSFIPKSPITLMTPEPGAGFYRATNAATFVRKFGYPDKSGKPDRINFGGIYACGKDFHKDTRLRMTLNGYDDASGEITDIDGGLQLIAQDDGVAAEWKFTALMGHWNRKHAQAAYVPSLMRTPPPEYAFGSQILLCEQTDFILFLKAFADGSVYYDPALKIENASNPIAPVKLRSQFRIKHNDITRLYHRHEIVDLRALPT
jgi:hypothetical protein